MFPTWLCEGRENLTVESLVTVANTLKVRVPALFEPPTEGQERASKLAPGSSSRDPVMKMAPVMGAILVCLLI